MANQYVGGIRARLVRDNLYYLVKNSLTSLGWFNTGRQHKPIIFLESEVAQDTDEVQFNTLALADADISGIDDEMGSRLTERTWSFFLDFYAEDDVIGLHLIRDVQDLLEGRMPSIGRNREWFNVYDLTQATPPLLFACEIANVSVDRAHNFPRAWQQHWYSAAFEVIDHYTDENG